jgi:hypothetical protein
MISAHDSVFFLSQVAPENSSAHARAGPNPLCCPLKTAIRWLELHGAEGARDIVLDLVKSIGTDALKAWVKSHFPGVIP